MFTNDSSSSYEDYSSDDDDDYKKDPFNHELAEKSGVVDSKITNDNSHTVLNLLSRCIIHLDIDCFYCQCEEILNPHLAKKPLAIGQKHIVVTSNYAARKLGVKKLMGRNEALKVCPSLTIVEGSDLEKYKKASREVYIEFRRAVKEFGGENKVKKGCMDEMFADITFAVERHGTSTDDNSMNFKTNTPSNTFIYGEDGRSSIVKISETQSGAEATISNKPSSSVGGNFTGRYRYSNENNWGSVHERKNCEERLQIATIIASQVRERVRLKTKYSTTIGVSVSPMLSKLASDLKKPDANNLLYPWRAMTIILNMPLRRIPGLGSRTQKALSTCLQNHNGRKQQEEFWTCRDLLNVPRNAIVSCLSECQSFQKNCEEQCDLLLNRCNGIDPIMITDDGGSLTKTVSVEDSFIRGLVISMNTVRQKLDLLYGRLLRLLKQRKESSPDPKQSYPRAIRVSVRMLDKRLENSGRRPFRTISKQNAFNGKRLMEENHIKEQISILHTSALPILESLFNQHFDDIDVNVTRLNLAAISFADINMIHPTKHNGHENTSQKSLSNYFRANDIDNERPFCNSNSSVSQSLSQIQSTQKRKCTSPIQTNIVETKSSISNSRPSSSRSSSNEYSKRPKIKTTSDHTSSILKPPPGIDPTIFASLPKDIANEVMQNQTFHQHCTKAYEYKTGPKTGVRTITEKKKKKSKGIESFFQSKKK